MSGEPSFQIHRVISGEFGAAVGPEVDLPTLCAEVVSGMGTFSYWIETLHDNYLRKTGMRLFPGTLNVQLDEPYSLPR